MQLAFAAAAAGHEVELRGWLHEPTFRRFAEAAGAAPRIDLEPGRPKPATSSSSRRAGRTRSSICSSRCRPLASRCSCSPPPGLFGWDFSERWSLPDPLTVDIATLARPEHFAAMRALGFELVTHSPDSCAAAAARRRVHVPRHGTAMADAGARGEGGRRRRPARQPLGTAGAQGGRRARRREVDFIEEAPNDEVLARMARARVLIWPSRIEGHATIPHEARSVGCVPVGAVDQPVRGRPHDEDRRRGGRRGRRDRACGTRAARRPARRASWHRAQRDGSRGDRVGAVRGPRRRVARGARARGAGTRGARRAPARRSPPRSSAETRPSRRRGLEEVEWSARLHRASSNAELRWPPRQGGPRPVPQARYTEHPQAPLLDSGCPMPRPPSTSRTSTRRS